MKPSMFVSAVALVDVEGSVLLGQRLKGKHMADMWEFPGGKVEQGETPEVALIRELKEELGIDVEQSCLAPFTFVTHEYEEFTLILLLYLCRKWQGIVQPLEGQNLIWRMPHNMSDLAMPPADVPLVAMLRDFL
ncbi:MAG: (deoxy)nucleoside triphosphate pyrophosphohydrolase [Alphaproteobacteria bacterium]|nr:(deoxy)nucleoside triphosphate pyrophosphohydrolase [Alphaproteobacteria bacterium]